VSAKTAQMMRASNQIVPECCNRFLAELNLITKTTFNVKEIMITAGKVITNKKTLSSS
jgi:hypothetical protein